MSYNLTQHPGSYSGFHPVAAGAVIEIGALTAINAAGDAVPAGATVTGRVIGRADADTDNTGGSAGDLTTAPKRGVFGCANSQTDPVDKSHVLKMVFAESPDTIRASGTCRAGILIGFESDGSPIVDVTHSAVATHDEFIS